MAIFGQTKSEKRNSGKQAIQGVWFSEKQREGIEAVSAWQGRREEEARHRGRKTTSHSAWGEIKRERERDDGGGGNPASKTR